MEVICRRCNEHLARMYATADGLVLHVGPTGIPVKGDRRQRYELNIEQAPAQGFLPVRCSRHGEGLLSVAELKAAAAKPRPPGSSGERRFRVVIPHKANTSR